MSDSQIFRDNCATTGMYVGLVATIIDAGYTLTTGDPNTQLTDIIRDSFIHTPIGIAAGYTLGSIPVIRQSVEYLQDRYR